MNKTFKILEIIWLLVGCTGILFCAYFIVKKDNEQAFFFLIFTFASGIMYAVRKRQRKRAEASDKEQKQ